MLKAGNIAWRQVAVWNNIEFEETCFGIEMDPTLNPDLKFSFSLNGQLEIPGYPSIDIQIDPKLQAEQGGGSITSTDRRI